MTNPLKALLVGITGTAIFGSFSIYLFFFASSPLKPSDIEAVRGNLDRAEILRPTRGSESLQIWLVGQQTPFRGTAGYPDLYRKEALNHLIASAPVEIGVRPSDRMTPPRDRINSQNFIPIYSITVGETPIFTLGDYNRWNIENQKIGRYLAPTLLVCSLLSVSYGWSRLRRSSPEAL